MPKRPTKKKPSEQDEQPAEAPQADERNLVIVDEDFEEADIEDKLWLFWERNKVVVVATVILAIVGVLGVQGYNAWQASQLESMRLSFAEAETPEARLDFAQNHADHPLSAVARMEVARERFEAGEFAAAAELYEQAILPANGSALEGAPALRAGVAYIRAGNAEKGSELLKDLLDKKAILETYRAEAGYHLGILALGSGNYEEAASIFGMVRDMPNAGIWAAQSQSQLETDPNLQGLAANANAPAQAGQADRAPGNPADEDIPAGTSTRAQEQEQQP